MSTIKTTRFAPTAAVAIGAVCFLFAAGAKADCGASAIPRSINTLPDFVAGGITADSLGNQKPHLELPQASSAPESKDESNASNTSIVGLWLITFTSGGQIVDQGFDMWTSDGTEILNDTPPPATGNVCLGTWVKAGPNTFKLKHPSWTFDNSGNLSGTAIIRETVTIQPGGNAFKGTFTVDVLTLSGANILHIVGTLSATRITVD